MCLTFLASCIQHQTELIDIKFNVASYRFFLFTSQIASFRFCYVVRMIGLSKIFYSSSYSQNNCHFQFAEFVHTIQALQIELADLRERNATSTDESRASESNIKDASQSGNNVGNQLNVSGDPQTHNSVTLPNGNLENDLSSLSQGNASGHVGQVDSYPVCFEFYLLKCS